MAKRRKASAGANDVAHGAHARRRVHLPSGRVVAVSWDAARAATVDAASTPTTIRAALALLRVPGVVTFCEPGSTSAAEVEPGSASRPVNDGTPLALDDLPLGDGHVLVALLLHEGIGREEEAEFSCDNCEAPFRAAPSRLFEPAPFYDGELADPEIDAPFDFTRDHSVPAIPLPATTRRARTVRFAPRTIGEAAGLLRATERRRLDLTPAVVTAMGVVALGDQRRASTLAAALTEASEASWDAVVSLWLDAHYPQRLMAVHRCASCGARNDLDVPLLRELDRGAGAEGGAVRRRAGAGAFPDLDEFERRVREAAERVYASRRVRNVDLFVDAGVPLCDEGGEPLLGCYTPPGTDGDLGVPQAPEVRIFYRSFAAEHERDPEFDVDAEIEETLDHEITHHLHHLAGDDPLDDEERAEIDRERARIVGHREAQRRALRSTLADLRGFVRTTWPIWVLALVASALAWCR